MINNLRSLPSLVRQANQIMVQKSEGNEKRKKRRSINQGHRSCAKDAKKLKDFAQDKKPLKTLVWEIIPFLVLLAPNHFASIKQ